MIGAAHGSEHLAQDGQDPRRREHHPSLRVGLGEQHGQRETDAAEAGDQRVDVGGIAERHDRIRAAVVTAMGELDPAVVIAAEGLDVDPEVVHPQRPRSQFFCREEAVVSKHEDVAEAGRTEVGEQAVDAVAARPRSEEQRDADELQVESHGHGSCAHCE
ncbi:MAG: hypothetical protein U1E76_08115 [Planctomycetota bacterium]